MDPQRGGTLRMTSDEFFAQNRETFDLVFVDGLHLREQVVRDVDNAVRCLNLGGCIVLHDCLPTTEEQQVREPVRPGASWTGDVWKAVVDLRQRADYDLAVLASDWGLGVLFARENSDALAPPVSVEWNDYTADRIRLLRIVDEAGIRRFIGGEQVVALGPVTGLSDIPQPPEPLMATDFMKSGLAYSPRPVPEMAAAKESRRPTNAVVDRPLTIAFAHGAMAQFRELHLFLNQSGWAKSFLLCSDSVFRKHQGALPNLIPFKAHGNKLQEKNSLFHLTRVEGAVRRSLGLRPALKTLHQQTPIDLFVGHLTAGCPLMLLDQFEFPIVSYMEFPSFQEHGWDARFPPGEARQLHDRSFEMLSWYLAMKSDHTIVPSGYAREMFPQELRSQISVLMEGFPLESKRWSQCGGGILSKQPGEQYVGFAARDLSSAKGFDQFVRIANRVAALRPNVRFVVLGNEKTIYSYEGTFLEKTFGKGHCKNFRDWVLDEEQADRSRFLFPGLVGYDDFARYVHDIDVFLYPLQFGSANWGLFEMLGRGKPVIASNRCFVPEVITHAVNGRLCRYDDLDAWVQQTIALLDDVTERNRLGDIARRMSVRYSIDRVAADFLKLAERLITAKHCRSTNEMSTLESPE